MISETDILHATAVIVGGYLRGQPAIVPSDFPQLIKTVHGALSRLGEPIVPPRPDPAVPVNKSVRQNGIVCLECGWEGRMLKRHLGVAHSLSPENYRERWGLQHDYPMVTPAYAEVRRRIAKELGLGIRNKGGNGT